MGLIAAAPELLTELKRLVEIAKVDGIGVHLAEAIIAKVEGKETK
jgi:hypothetical protein